ncbi:PH domain-containing protein [Streptomyces alkaliterrae]|uniref:PH domain-containing protein n=1 Tax=Streptomyces alkaliterrae TaxID=2213162 RepID=A0A5P0YWR4_9ACTN|nr:PH domain-containing protein [Streptomyces alkaliterrae]MBB1255216.1 PH domain-containing protein [Streptomyces alkaliterrae]MBB1258919.1 PH domain-containing protein [Streptomyces alkaliterrae]MQS03932.1 PH domain-containing protein [Streptomyces alkaliterrae]
MSSTSPQPPALPVTFRPTRTRVVLLSVGAAILVVLGVIGLALDLAPGERISFIAVGLLCFGVLALLSRPRATADEDGLTVVNLTRTRRLAWAEIVRVNLRTGDPWVMLDLSDGTTWAVMGIQPGIGKHRALEDAAALRTLAERHGSGREEG